MEDLCIAAPRPLRLFAPVTMVHRPRPRIISAPVEAFARFSLSDDPVDDLRPTASSPQSNPSPNPSPASYNDPTPGTAHVVYDSSSTRYVVVRAYQAISRSSDPLDSPDSRPSPALRSVGTKYIMYIGLAYLKKPSRNSLPYFVHPFSPLP